MIFIEKTGVREWYFYMLLFTLAGNFKLYSVMLRTLMLESGPSPGIK